MTQAARPFLRGRHVLAVSPVGSYGGFNTSIHRVRALESLGAGVQVLDTALERASGLAGFRRRFQNRLFLFGLPLSLPDVGRTEARLAAAAAQHPWDIVWLEKALTVGKPALAGVRERCPNAKIVGFSPDDMFGRHNQSQQFLEALPLYDAFITTKSHNVAELGSLGCRRVVFVDNGFDPEAFRPSDVSGADMASLGGDVGFIGSYEKERAEHMYFLARSGIRVRIWGGGWEAMRSQHENLKLEHAPLYGEDFAKACRAFKINLGFLRKLNRDRQTTRSVEIPACEGFMLAERTEEHRALFEEGTEAEFFSTREELLEKCRRYLADHAGRESIARRGRERCIASGYDNASRLCVALSQVL